MSLNMPLLIHENVTVDNIATLQTGDLADMARIVEQAVATNPDGIVLSKLRLRHNWKAL